MFQRILVPHDFSEHASQALKLAAEIASELGGRLLVVHAIPPFVPLGAISPGEVPAWLPPDELVADEHRRLESLVTEALAERPVPYECSVVVGQPFDQIMAAARKVDLIVMATAGRTGLSHLVIGSVAEKVVRHAPVPVLTVRPSTAPVASAERAPGTRRSTSRRPTAKG